MILTATPIETKELHRKLKPLPGYSSCMMTENGAYTYYLGVLGEYLVAHMQCEMGSVSPGASLPAASHGIDFWDPKAVLMVGIAFGIDKKKQKIGDVLISRAVIPYDIRREGRIEVVRRSVIPPSGPTLLNRFKNQPDWKHFSSRGKRADAIDTDMLSGEALIDNQEFRDSLLQTFKTAKGGEMEGVGLFAAAHEKRKEWLIVKGICDFADGNKKKRKAINQAEAIRAAVSLCLHTLSKKTAFRDLQCEPVASTSCPPCGEETVLFDIFKTGCAPYYLKRPADKTIHSLQQKKSLWLAGPSGCGKTNAARFSLLTGNQPFHFIDLSRCVGLSVKQLLGAIHAEIAEQLSLHSSPPSNDEIHDTIEAIGNLFKGLQGKPPAFMVDEIPLNTSSEFQHFVEAMCGLMIYLRNEGHKVQFIFASVESPHSTLQPRHQKITEQIHFVLLPMWSNQEIEGLLNLVLPGVPLTFSASEKKSIVEGANGSPRTLKAILRNAILFSKDTEWPLDRIIRESNSFSGHV